jgi:WhiB family redox-sensing transcriptional regulator
MSSTTIAPTGARSAASCAVDVAVHASAPAIEDTDWTTRAACLRADPDDLFVRGAEQNKVKTRCLACQVRTECLADALDNRVEFGVWGGMTERERRALLRRRPDVVSWRALLERARQEHLAATSFGIAG